LHTEEPFMQAMTPRSQALVGVQLDPSPGHDPPEPLDEEVAAPPLPPVDDEEAAAPPLPVDEEEAVAPPLPPGAPPAPLDEEEVAAPPAPLDEELDEEEEVVVGPPALLDDEDDDATPPEEADAVLVPSVPWVAREPALQLALITPTRVARVSAFRVLIGASWNVITSLATGARWDLQCRGSARRRGGRGGPFT